MKLIDYLRLRITLFFTIIMLLWSGIYFFLQMNEINDGNDEGLTNLKQEFVLKANSTPGFVENMQKNTPLNLIVKEISQNEAEKIIENFHTTTVYFASELEEEEVRMLTSAFFCTLNNQYYKIQFFTSTVESEDLIESMLYLLLGLWIVLILTVIFVSKIIISWANKPFYSLLQKLKTFRLDNSKMIDFPETKIEEYQQLNEAVKELLQKDIKAFTKQKQFIENTSHELQTPVAIVIARLEMLLETYQNDKHLTEEIAHLLNTLNRMKRLNSNLLLLSKIKNNQFIEISEVNLHEVLNTVLADFEDLAVYREITIECNKGENVLAPTVRMNPDLAHILFTNLIKNAIAHGEKGGKIIISYEKNTVIISNNGTKPIDNIFARYNRDKDTAQDISTNGLGLSIVKSIIDLYKININYRFENGLHIFEIKLGIQSDN